MATQLSITEPSQLTTDPHLAWDAAMLQLRDAKLAHDTAWAQFCASKSELASDPRSEQMSRITDSYSGVQDLLLATPAPHLPALRWKLDYFLAIEHDGHTASWSGKYVHQTLDDIARLLVGPQLEGGR